MKVDAHCAFAQGFDKVLIEDMQPDWTIVPVMRNLHAFDWVCPNGHRRYQGQSGVCKECGEPTTMDVVWIAKPSPQSTSYRFDSEPHFQYFGEFKHRPEGQGDLTETMSLQGSCFMMSREKYFELDVCDEVFGSWGSQGIEVAVKTWLSGGRVICDHKTWYAHLFRTQGGDFGFPYPNPGHSMQSAKKKAKDLFFDDKWEKQIKPLSWLIRKFWPVPGWTEENLSQLRQSSTMTLASFPLADTTNSLIMTTPVNNSDVGKGMPIATEILSGSEHIIGMSNQSQMPRITTPVVVANMVEFQTGINDGSNKPSIGETMDSDALPVCSASSLGGIVEKPSISSMIKLSSPIPTSSNNIEFNITEKPRDGISINILDDNNISHGLIIQQNMVNSKGIVYFTDNQLDAGIMKACQEQLKKATNGHRIVSVSLKPMDFGDNIVLPLERGYLTMFKQILVGLEELDCDVVFFAEHDVLYHPSHFEFVPSERNGYYYNRNTWKLRMEDGHGLSYECGQTSGLCAYRELLVQHYKQRVINTEKAWELYGGNTWNFRNFIRRQGFEPGTHHRAESVDQLNFEYWDSELPNIDIRHSGNLTPNRWSIDQFRRKPRTWVESDEIPGWGKGIDIVRRLQNVLG
jgi:hypothetical protein